MPKSALTIPVLVVACAFSPSCNMVEKSAPSAINGARFYAVTAEQAAFYQHGPQQGNGPDTSLPRDTLVSLIRPSFGYSKVKVVSSGQQGYVLSDEMKVASASLVLAATATPTPPRITAAKTTPKFDLNSSDPRLAPPPEQLPAPDLPPDLPSETPTPIP